MYSPNAHFSSLLIKSSQIERQKLPNLATLPVLALLPQRKAMRNEADMELKL